MPTMKGKRILTSIYLDPPVAEALRKLSDETRVPQSVYLREALDDLLAKYKVRTKVRKS
ncbi:MAG: ribbon-helix-helix domain-containing protein [Bradyrhizobium sp.]